MGISRYGWLVLFAAWLGWGFDIFDSLLFNVVAPNCVPTLLHIPLGSPEAKKQTLQWTGILTSILLIGWGVGGIVFGRVADRIGRTKTMLLTMLLYSGGTFACALAPSIWLLMLFRIVAALGIGGEWAAGASMVAETVPENRRVEAGALLYTAAPLGLMLATFANRQISGVLFVAQPEVSWRYVFACGLIPAIIAFGVRLFVREPERWQNAVAHTETAPTIAELFGPKYLRTTLGGLAIALAALLSWWSSNAFLPVVSGGLAAAQAASMGLEGSAAQAFTEGFKSHASTVFNVAGLVGTLCVIPAAKYLSRRALFGVCLLLIAASMLVAFGFRWPLETQALLYAPIGFSTYGIFAALTFYLPELYPTRLRATGAGFTYNTGRLATAVGPFLVGSIAARGADASQSALQALFYVGFIPLLGLMLLPLVTETKGRALLD